MHLNAHGADTIRSCNDTPAFSNVHSRAIHQEKTRRSISHAIAKTARPSHHAPFIPILENAQHRRIKHIDMKRFRILVTGLMLISGATIASAEESSGSACRASTPPQLAGQPARWLGPCASGAADGLGVMRVGTAQPYRFFLGEMKAGRPVRGLLKVDGGWQTLGHAIPPSKPEDGIDPVARDNDAMFELGARAAQATAKRFSAQGNRQSAAYYERLAREVTDGMPE